jgi:hypothetical protein
VSSIRRAWRSSEIRVGAGQGEVDDEQVSRPPLQLSLGAGAVLQPVSVESQLPQPLQ